MTSGFWKGLLHGALICTGGLAVLSLVSPMPGPGEPPVDQVAETVESAEIMASGPIAEESPSTEEPVAESVAPEAPAAEPIAETVEPPDAPTEAESVAHTEEDNAEVTEPVQAEIPPEDSVVSEVDLPVGSEFGRGGDDLPLMPGPMDSPSMDTDVGDAPGVIAPANEVAPVATALNDARPQIVDSGLDGMGAVAQSDEAAPSFERPSDLSAPSAPGTPEMLGAAEPDAMPDMSGLPEPTEVVRGVIQHDPHVGVQVVEPMADAPRQIAEPEAQAATVPPQLVIAPEPVQETAAEPVAEPPVQEEAAAPAVGAGTLDLSLPPSIAELRNTESN